MAIARLRGHKLTITAYAAVILVALLGLSAVWADEAPAATENLINITVKDAQVARVLDMIARAGGVNIVVGDDVTGDIKSINLTDVTVEEALQLIAQADNLYWRKIGNAYIVSKTPPPTPIPVETPPMAVPSPALTPPAPNGTQIGDISSHAPPPPVGPTQSVVTDNNKIVVESIPIKHIDAGQVAEMFGGTSVGNEGGGYVMSNPYGGSRTEGGLGAAAAGFNEMQAPGAPGGNGMFGQFGGGFGGGSSGGFGGSSNGIGSSNNGSSSNGFGSSNGTNGSNGGLSGSASFAQFLPTDVSPPIAFMPLNLLIVTGAQEGIDKFREMVALIDQPVKEVTIATKFITVQTTGEKDFGIDFFVDNGSLGFFNTGMAPGTGLTVVRFSRGNFQATLRTLETEGRVQLINEPRVTTENNMPAEVQFTTTIPYFTSTVTYNDLGNQTVSNTVNSISVQNLLYVTPRINSDDSVTLALEPQISDTAGVVTAPDGTTLPIVTTQTVMTQVTVNDGETLAIGGLMRRNDSINIRRTPLLSDIPILGELFNSKTDSTSNSELIVFVTPQIVRELPRD